MENEIKKYIKEYIKNHLKITVLLDNGDDYYKKSIRVKTILSLDDEIISEDSDQYTI